METFFHVVSILLFVLFCFHFIFVSVSIAFGWSFTSLRRGPEYKIYFHSEPVFTCKCDAAVLFHFIEKSNDSFLITVIKDLCIKDQERQLVDEPNPNKTRDNSCATRWLSCLSVGLPCRRSNFGQTNTHRLETNEEEDPIRINPANG